MKRNEYRVVSRPADEVQDGRTVDRYTAPAATVTYVQSVDAAGAENLVLIKHPTHVVMEVSMAAPAIDPSPQEVVDAVTDYLVNGMGYDPTDLTDFEGYDGDFSMFLGACNEVCRALRESLCPGVDLTLVGEIDGPIGYSMVEREGHVSGQYRSMGCDTKNLTEDRSARGVEAYAAIARNLISYYNLMR